MKCIGRNCPMQYGTVDPAHCLAADECPYVTKPLTNADRIRAMTDEELAETITADWCSIVCPGGSFFCDGECVTKVTEWLKQEVDS